MITETMTVPELVSAIRARRECRHDRASAFYLANTHVVRVRCDDCDRRADVDGYLISSVSAAILCSFTQDQIATLARGVLP
jgi:hypothetical protein